MRIEQGKLIAVEGLPGSGKTTAAQALAAGRGAVYGRPLDRSDDPLIDGIVEALTERSIKSEAERFGFMAAVHAHFFAETVGPALKDGQDVVLDGLYSDLFDYGGTVVCPPAPPLFEAHWILCGGVEPDALFELKPTAEVYKQRVARHLDPSLQDRVLRIRSGLSSFVSCLPDMLYRPVIITPDTDANLAAIVQQELAVPVGE